jgi:hypothetical protein
MIGFTSLGSASGKQFRYMMHCWGQKPHLDMIKGQWRCVGRHLYGCGATPSAALQSWTQQRDSLDEWERRR